MVGVRVREYPDRALAVFHGPRRLARHGEDGTPLREQRKSGRVSRFDATTYPQTRQQQRMRSIQFVIDTP
jgi:hypothetical protein